MGVPQFAVDPSVILDLSRRLQFAPPQDQGETRRTRSARPDASVLVEAVSNAAASIAHRDEQIRRLERHQHEDSDLIARMKSKLGELLRLQQTTDAHARAETERADRAEAKAMRLEARNRDLEVDLDAALTDLHRIADVITGSLIVSDRR